MSADWRSLLVEAQSALQAGRPDDAISALESAYALAPDQKLVRYWLGNACRSAGQLERAEALLAGLVTEQSDDADAAFALAFLHRDQGRAERAAKILEELAEGSNDRKALLRATGFLRDINHFDAAVRVLDKALGMGPDEPGLRFRRARLLQGLGRFDAAIDDCRAAVNADPSLAGAWLSLATLQRFETEDDPDFKLMQTARERVPGIEAKTAISFALGKALDDLGRHAEAFDQYQKGNALLSTRQPWDRNLWESFVNQVPQRQLPSVDQGFRPARPVFVIGMLRSGTTLLEELLGRHPMAHGRGELNWLGNIAREIPDPANLSAQQRNVLGSELWKQMRQHDPDDHVFIDKNPLNFRFVSLALAILPDARFIHVKRDGRASCLSCFFQMFQHPDAGFCNDLDDLAAYYDGYRKLMAHWQQLYADRIVEVDYSELVGDTEATLRRLTEFVGLNWDSAMLSDADDERTVRTASAWQARQGVHTDSIEKWRFYEGQAPQFFGWLKSIDAEYS